MNRLVTTGKLFYAAAFIVFGIQHFMYSTFVATLVPGWIPWHLFWALFVGVAFILAATSLIINKYVLFTGMMMGIMLMGFILLIHIPRLFVEPQNAMYWTRALQDVTILGTALMLTGDTKLGQIGRYLFAVPMIFLGLQHFAHTALATAMIPAWFPAIGVWDYLVGAIMLIMSIMMITNRYMGVPALMLGAVLLLFALLYHVPPMVKNISDGQHWTGFMLDVAVAGGAFISAGLASASYKTVRMAT